MYRKVAKNEPNCDTENVNMLDGRFAPVFTRQNLKNDASSDLIGKVVTQDTIKFVKPYSNICGIFAVGPEASNSAINSLEKYIDAVIEVASEQLPTFS